MLILGGAAILLLSTVAVVLAFKYGAFSSNNLNKNREDEREHKLAVIKKIKDAQLNGYRTTFFVTGLLISLSFTYYVINYTEFLEYIKVKAEETLYFEEEELVSLTDQTPPPPPPPEPEIKVPEFIESEEPVIEDDTINLEIDTTTVEDIEKNFAPPIKNLGPPEDKKAYRPDELAQIAGFPDGDFNKFITSNFEYPQRMIEQEEFFKGRVFIYFIVEKDGSLSNVKLIRGTEYKLLDKELIRVIKSSPKWKPAMDNLGLKKRMQFSVPFKF